MSGRLNWEAHNRRDRYRGAEKASDVTTMKCDEKFWQLWKVDKAAMKAAGYRIKKIDGQWFAVLR